MSIFNLDEYRDLPLPYEYPYIRDPFVFLEDEEHNGHRSRLRNRIARYGLERLKPHELVEYLLYHAVPRQDVKQMAEQVVDTFGDLRNLKSATDEELFKLNISRQAVEFLSYYMGCLRSIESFFLPRRLFLKNFGDTAAHIEKICLRTPANCCTLLCATRDGQLIYQRRITSGMRWAEYPVSGEIIRNIISSHARSILLVLHTDREAPAFSDYDADNVLSFMRLMKSMNCALLDVMCANKHGCISMRRTSLMDEGPVAPRLRLVCEEYTEGLNTFLDKHKA